MYYPSPAFLLGCALALAGDPMPADGLDRAEELGTKIGDSENSVARQVLADPGKFSLDFPAFLVGVEKARRGKIGAPKLPDLELGLEGWASKYINFVTFSNVPIPGLNSRAERMFVSHLIEFARPDGAAGPYSATVRYSAYKKDDLGSAKDAFPVGRDRLLGLRGELKEAIRRERPTHLIVFSTGWNTDQEGTFAGMRRIQDALAKTAEGREFRPLMIGISWPSMSERLGPDLQGTTYNIKSCDADEVGLVWSSTLVNQVLVPARDDLLREGGLPRRPDVVVIGHSFGARIVTWTAFCGGLRPSPGKPDARVLGPDYVIGLQGAFSIARFVEGEGVEGAPYAARPAGTRFAYTASENDKAVETFNTLSGPINRAIAALAKFSRLPRMGEAHLGVPHIGGKTAFGLDSEEYRRVFEHRSVADPVGHLDHAAPAAGEKVLLVDASAIIKALPDDARRAAFSGAHNDVYNVGVGRLIWQVIAPVPPAR